MTGLSLVLVGHFFFAAPSEPPADLMKKLAEQDARFDKVEKEGSYTVTEFSEELAADQSVEHTSKVVTRVTFRAGKQEKTLLKAEADGKDRTEKARKKLKEEESENDVSISTSSPFGAADQPKYGFTVVGADNADPSLLRIKYEPKGKKSESLGIGEAVVDPVAGEVVRLVQRPSENPSHITRLDFMFRFDERTPVGRLLSKVTTDGEGGFLFIKKRFRATVTYSDYELPVGMAAAQPPKRGDTPPQKEAK
jgi:hypothetical protein